MAGFFFISLQRTSEKPPMPRYRLLGVAICHTLGVSQMCNPIAFFMAENTNLPSANKDTNLIKQFIITHYKPASSYIEAKVKISTSQLLLKLKEMFPGAEMTVSDMHIFMTEQEFSEVEIRPFSTEWILDKK